MSPPTTPEGVPTPSESEISDVYSRGKSILVIVSVVVGIILGTGTIFGGVGKAFYVEREEYNARNLQDARDKVDVQKTIERVSDTLKRQEQALDKLSTTIDRLSTAVLEIQVRSRRDKER